MPHLMRFFTFVLPDGTTRQVNYKGRAMQVRM